jgi:hypothetical protein
VGLCCMQSVGTAFGEVHRVGAVGELPVEVFRSHCQLSK